MKRQFETFGKKGPVGKGTHEPERRKPVRLSVAAAAALLVVLTGCHTATAQDAFADALQCSKAALTAYALSSSEPAEKIADVAFDKCSEKWSRAAELAGRDPAVSRTTAEAQENCIKKLGAAACPNPLPYRVYLTEAAKRTFRHDAVIEVFDLRAKAAGK